MSWLLTECTDSDSDEEDEEYESDVEETNDSAHFKKKKKQYTVPDASMIA